MSRAPWLLLISAGLAAQAEIPIGGPFLGYVVEAGAGVRPVRGIPGASSLGDPIGVGLDVSTWAVSNEHEYAVAVTASDRSPMLVDLATSQVRALTDAAPGVDRVVLSPSGAAAVFYRSDPSRIETITGLPGNYSVQRSIELAEAPAAMAVSDDGEVLVAIPGSAVRVSRSGDIRHAVSGDIAAIVYLRQSRDALVAERSGRLLLIRESGEQAVLFSADHDSFGEPVAVAADRERAYLASASRVAVVPLGGDAAEILDCSCTITSLDRMKGDSLFRLTDIGAGPVWLLDKNRMVFVPAAGGAQ